MASKFLTLEEVEKIMDDIVASKQNLWEENLRKSCEYSDRVAMDLIKHIAGDALDKCESDLLAYGTATAKIEVGLDEAIKVERVQPRKFYIQHAAKTWPVRTVSGVDFGKTCDESVRWDIVYGQEYLKSAKFLEGQDWSSIEQRIMGYMNGAPDWTAKPLAINRLAPYIYGGRQQGKTATMKLTKAQREQALEEFINRNDADRRQAKRDSERERVRAMEDVKAANRKAEYEAARAKVEDERKARWNGRYRVVKVDMSDGTSHYVAQQQDALGWVPMVQMSPTNSAESKVMKHVYDTGAEVQIELHIRALAAYHVHTKGVTTVKD